MYYKDPYQLHDKRSLDVRALGDLSGFTALCKLTFVSCEVQDVRVRCCAPSGLQAFPAFPSALLIPRRVARLRCCS